MWTKATASSMHLDASLPSCVTIRASLAVVSLRLMSSRPLSSSLSLARPSFTGSSVATCWRFFWGLGIVAAGCRCSPKLCATCAAHGCSGAALRSDGDVLASCDVSAADCKACWQNLIERQKGS